MVVRTCMPLGPMNWNLQPREYTIHSVTVVTVVTPAYQGKQEGLVSGTVPPPPKTILNEVRFPPPSLGAWVLLESCSSAQTPK